MRRMTDMTGGSSPSTMSLPRSGAPTLFFYALFMYAISNMDHLLLSPTGPSPRPMRCMKRVRQSDLLHANMSRTCSVVDWKYQGKTLMVDWHGSIRESGG